LQARIVSGATMKELAGEFGLSRQAIGQVVQRRGLQHRRPRAMCRAGCLRPVASAVAAAAQTVKGLQAARTCGHRNGRSGLGSAGRRHAGAVS
jgi:hypothetical protein